MRAPDFWQQPAGLLSGLLSPVGALYGSITARRATRAPDHTPGIPVICIGNAVMGGAGKTPVARALAMEPRIAARSPHILTRGYGGRESGPLRVDPAIHDATAVGDEALLLAKAAPTWVCRDRVAGAKAIEAAGAGLILMDDGYQNSSLAKSLSLLVIDTAYMFGNGRAFPAGPLREAPESALARADAVIALGEDWAAQHFAGKPVFRARLEPDDGMKFRGIAVHAFSGIGRPEKFFRTLTAAGASIRKRVAFADHHPFSEAEIRGLLDDAATDSAVAVTTEKDHVRLPPDLRDRVRVLTVSLAWDDNGALLDMVENARA